MRSLSKAERPKWDGGKASGAVYMSEADHSSLVADAYALFWNSNPLHPDLWPSSLKFEREVGKARGFASFHQLTQLPEPCILAWE